MACVTVGLGSLKWQTCACDWGGGGWTSCVCTAVWDPLGCGRGLEKRFRGASVYLHVGCRCVLAWPPRGGGAGAGNRHLPDRDCFSLV